VKRSVFPATVVVATALFAVACGSSSDNSGGGGGSSSSSTAASGGAEAAGARGGTLITRANAAPAGSPDPQVNYTAQEWQFLIMSHDGLVGFKRAGGAEGSKLVADLATEVPQPTDNGTTYTFTLRPNIKFSDGKTVTAADVKATFERLFKIGDSPNAGTWYSVIKGADACIKTPKSCDLTGGVDVSGNQITFHLTGSDPEFLQKLAVPFAFILPKDTPSKNVDFPPPGTGPYKWTQYEPNAGMKLERNTFFKEWSKDAQPDGLPDVIDQRFGLSVGAAVTQVENGQADWVFYGDSIPSDRLNELSTKYAKQVHIDPQPATYYFAFNTTIPPFDNLKARQAVNYATDRNALIKLYGGPKLASPTCQVLPPEFPGYKPYCPYTANPGSGKWTGPDMAKARQLVEESGTKGMRVKVNSAACSTSSATRPRRSSCPTTSSTPTSRTRRTRCSSPTRAGSPTTRRRRTSCRSCSAAARSTRTRTRARTSPSSATRTSRRTWTRRARRRPRTSTPRTRCGHRPTRTSPTRRRGWRCSIPSSSTSSRAA
jgi:peptide/nickel transport system substrate-binding protein